MDSTKNKTDLALKLIVVLLIAAFLGLTAFSMLGGKSASGAASPPAGMMGAAGSPPAGMGAPPAGTGAPPAGTGSPPTGTSAALPASPQTAQGGAGAGAESAGKAGGNAAVAAVKAAAAKVTGSAASQAPAGAAAAGASARGSAGASGAAQSRITVSAQTMERGVIRQTVRLNGGVSPETEVGIYPDTAGKVTRLLKSLGDSVQRGEVIAYVDPSKAGASYEQNPVAAAVSGSIIALPVSVGDTVASSTKIASVGSLSNLKITVYVAEKYSAYLRTGLPADVTFAAAPGEVFRARVAEVSPVVNSANRTVETKLVLDKRDARIKPGMFADVSLVIREREETFVLPKAAVKNYNDSKVIYVIDANDVARRITVNTGLSNDAETEVLTGVSEGDRVITAGAVTDGSPVRVAERS